MTAPIGITLSLDGAPQVEAGLRRVAGGVDAVGVSAKQTAAALRGVPAQFTDIVTSLASGQQPLTVFLQQGGQLKDMFGGAGNAAKALGGYVVGLVNPFTVAAAAGVALALAYKQGSAEADAYARSIALTGNAAGVTTSQLQGMAERVSAVAGTQSKAAEVVAQLVGTGSVASQSLEQFTATAIRLERNAGVAVKDTVKEFAELGKEPVDAAKKLNERYNYLTAAVYEQIKALQEQGKASEAAALSQQTYDKAMSLVASTLEGRLGYIERAWRAVGDASRWAWDKMLNVGRPDTLKDQLDRARANLEQRLNTPLAVDNPAMRASREKGIEALRNEINLLQEQERMTRRGADAQAERAKAEKAGIEAADALLKTQDKGLSKQQQMNAALKEYRTQLEALRAVNPNSERLAPAAVARGERAIRDQFKDQAGAATGESELATIKAKITETEKYIEALRTQGLEGAKLTEGERMALKIREDLKTSITGTARANKELALVEAEKLGLVQRAAAAEEQRQKAVKKSTDEYAKLVESTFKAADALQDQADKQQAANAVYGKGAAAIDELALSTLKSRMAEAQASDRFSEKYIAALEAQIQAQERLNAARAEGRFKEMNESLDRELAAANQQAALYQDELRLTGLSALERAKIVALRQSELELARDLEKIEQSGLESDDKEQLRIKAREKQRVAGSAAVNKVIQDDFTRTSETIERSLTDALLRGFESGKSFAKNLRDTIANMFKTLVLRPIISAVVNPVAGAITGALGLAGTASAGTSALGAVSTAASGASLLGNAAGLLGGAGTAAGYGFSALMSGNGLGALSGGLGMLTSGGPAAIMAQGAGMIAGVLGPIALGIGALTAIIGKTKGETRTGGQFGVAFDGSVTNQRRGQTYTIEGQQFDRDFTNGLQTALKNGIAYRLEGDPVAQESAIREAVAGTASGINGFLKALGSSATLTGFSAGFETSTKDRGGNFAGGIFNNGATFGESGKGDNYAGTLYEKFSTNSPDFKTALENFTLDLKQSTIQALQVVTDIPQSVQKILSGVDAEALTEDAANKLLETINAQILGVEQLRSAFDAMNMQQFAGLAFDSAAAVAELSGGFDKLGNNLGTFYENFYTEGERAANTSRALAKSLAELGLELPASREQYRALVEAQDLNTEAGQRTYSTLLQLSGAFAGITESAESAANASYKAAEAERRRVSEALASAQKLVDSQRQTLAGLQTQAQNDLFTATGGAVGGIQVRAAEAEGVLRFKSALDDANGALTQLAGLGLEDRFAEYAAQIAAVVQGTKDLLGAQLSSARLLAGDSSGALSARQQARALNPEEFATAGAFNRAYAKQQADIAVGLIQEASANALTTQNVGTVIDELQKVLTRDELWRPVFAELQTALAGDSGGLRSALMGTAEYLARQSVAQQYGLGGPGIASVRAAQQGVGMAAAAGFAGGGYQIGADVLAYGQAIDSINRAQKYGSITAEEYDRGLAAINASFVDAAPLLGDTAAQVERLKGAYLGLANSGLASIGFYFTSLTDQAKALADAAAAAQEPIAQTTSAIGRLNSIGTAFGESARAVLEGLAGSGEQGRYALMQESLTGSQTSRAQLIAQSAAIAAGVITTADAAAAARKLAQSDAFAGLTFAGIRDAALLLDGVGAYDAKGFENAFLRINAALADSSINEGQYKALFDTALGVFQGVESETTSLAASMKNLRDVMGDFADQLLIDQGRTTLDSAATLAEMQRQYGVAFASASTGDSQAISKYQGLANGLLDKGLYSNQSEYNAVFGRVYGDARLLETVGVNTLAAMQDNAMVSELKDMNVKLNKRVDELVIALAQIAKNTADTSRGIEQQIVMAEDTAP